MSNKNHNGLDGRHRDVNGQISHKHGNATVEHLRNTYGDNFAQGARKDMKLETMLDRTGYDSLSQYIRDGKPPVS